MPAVLTRSGQVRSFRHFIPGWTFYLRPGGGTDRVRRNVCLETAIQTIASSRDAPLVLCNVQLDPRIPGSAAFFYEEPPPIANLSTHFFPPRSYLSAGAGGMGEGGMVDVRWTLDDASDFRGLEVGLGWLIIIR
jgi:hypothetical protein